jgi:ribosomal protein S5
VPPPTVTGGGPPVGRTARRQPETVVKINRSAKVVKADAGSRSPLVVVGDHKDGSARLRQGERSSAVGRRAARSPQELRAIATKGTTIPHRVLSQAGRASS